MNRIWLIVGKYHIVATAIGILCISGLGYLFVLGPKFSGIEGSTSFEVQTKQASIMEQEAELEHLQRLEEQLTSVTTSELARLEDILPHAEERDDLYLLFSSLASDLGLTLVGLDFSSAGTVIEESKAPHGLESDIQTVSVTISVDGVESYAGLKQFLSVLQDNMRLIDMNALSYQPDSTQYTLVLKMYYLSEKTQS